MQQQPIECIYVDDCCKVWNILQTIFGDKVEVKLDIFHAVQRITRTLSKRHSLYFQCISELRNVFHEFEDIHEERQVSTPPPEVMGVKMDNFIGKWKDACNSYGYPIFQADTYNALKNVMNHINMGCLRLVEEQIRMRDSISI